MCAQLYCNKKTQQAISMIARICTNHKLLLYTHAHAELYCNEDTNIYKLLLQLLAVYVLYLISDAL
jgi:hypothetical protein